MHYILNILILHYADATVEMNQTELLVIESEGVIQICVSAYISDTPNTNVNVTLNVKEGFQSE